MSQGRAGHIENSMCEAGEGKSLIQGSSERLEQKVKWGQQMMRSLSCQDLNHARPYKPVKYFGLYPEGLRDQRPDLSRRNIRLFLH